MALRFTYLDNAATTAVRPEAFEAMRPFLGRDFGNPSSMHRFGRAARAAVEHARRAVAAALGAEPNQVFFTSGGTEADNLAVIGGALAARTRGGPFRVAVTALEHKAVLDAAHFVEHLGGEAVVLPVSETGLDLDALDAALAHGVAVVSVMWVNNEVGVIQSVDRLAVRCRQAGAQFHTDAVQAVGKVPVSLRDTDIGLLSLSGHKIGAPQGTGALLVRDRRAIEPLLHGGGQQFGVRPGTENVPGIVALGKAVELAVAEQADLTERLRALRDDLEQRLLALAPDAVIHGSRAERAPHISTVSIPGTDSGTMLMHLDLAGIACSAGSACRTGDTTGSHVLAALGVPPELATGVLRFSFGRDNTAADVDAAISALPGAIGRVRALASALQR
ncbi:MAG TPA: cysteine desulfurase family protein [Gemmatimonadales bacterium]|nr:cysteine desulfurase family protein [Gemmatimonadales bacterium]